MSRGNGTQSQNPDLFDLPGFAEGQGSVAEPQGSKETNGSGDRPGQSHPPLEKPKLTVHERGSGVRSSVRESKPTARTSSTEVEVRFFTDRQVAKRLGVSRATIWRLRRDDPDFPVPVTLLAGSTRWFIEDLLIYEKILRERCHD
ncbi:helix-turn-helix transcriptional regulator [Hoeflea alexandrii]